MVNVLQLLDEALGAMQARPYLTRTRGALCRAPGGQVENASEMHTVGMQWLACNVYDFQPHEWWLVRERAQAVGMPCFTWGRLGIPGQDSTADCVDMLHWILSYASQFGAQTGHVPRAILDLEAEIKPPVLGGIITPVEVQEVIDQYPDVRIGISTEGWLYEMDWGPLRQHALLLQILPEDMGRNDPRWLDPANIPLLQKQCVRHARAGGFKYVSVGYQAYRSIPDWFDRRGHAWHVIFADDVGPGNWWRWIP